jgi:hypothetical protein
VTFAIQVGGGQAPHDKTGLEAIVEETLMAEERRVPERRGT